MGIDVSVIVTSWNSQAWIGRCLHSLMGQEGVQQEVLVVDNGSTDETRDIIRREAPTARLLFQTANRGPAWARNLGIRESCGRYLLTVDHDVELTPGFLRTIIEAADASAARVGMWSGHVLRPDRRIIDSTGIVLTTTWRAFDRGSGTRDPKRDQGEPNGHLPKAHEILGPSACAALYRREMLEEIREGECYFDEDFFFLWEDVELAWRATRRGWRAAYVPGAVCYHVRNGSGLSRSARQALSLRNRYLFIRKHRVWHPIGRYLWHCGLYEVARLGFMALTNPMALHGLGQVAWPSTRRAGKES